MSTIYRVQSEQVRGERRSYWIEKRSSGGAFYRRPTIVQDFGTNKRAAEKRCDELNALVATNYHGDVDGDGAL